ncbi:MAG: hypothetical protein KKG47_15010 [Proteobacteria bacterium]|nr:hypothetical protein [Pseudomonadota bacterium]
MAEMVGHPKKIKHEISAPGINSMNRSQKPEARSQKPEARSQKPEARRQKPE